MKRKRNGKRNADRKRWKGSERRRSEAKRTEVAIKSADQKKSHADRTTENQQTSAGRKFRPIKRHRRKRLKLGEAFRKYGLDEQTVAETYIGVVETLRETKGDKPETAQKLLLDILKECSRVLEPPRSSGAGAADAPAIVELHHEVSRPEYNMPAAAETFEPL